MAHKQPHVLIVGGAYGGLSALNTLISLSAGETQSQGRGPPPGRGPPGQGPPPPDPNMEIPRALRVKPRYTLLDERDGFYHTVGAPLGQISPSYAREFWLEYKNILKDTYANADVEFVQGRAERLSPEDKVLGFSYAGQERSIAYDYLVVATGMQRAWPVVPSVFEKTSFLAEVEGFSSQLIHSARVIVVGGGAVGIEMAAKVRLEYPHSEVILVHSRDKLLNAEPLPDEYKAKALELLELTGVTVKLGNRLISEKAVESTNGNSAKEVTLSSGETIFCDRVIYTATQSGANTDFMLNQGVDSNGCILVRDTLQFPESIPNADSHFAIGDVASWSGIKRSGPAQNMGRYAATNIVKSMLAVEDGKTTVDLAKCPSSPATMSLAIGEYAMSMRGGRLIFGKDVMQRAFGRGLGIEGTLKKLRLTPVAMEPQSNGVMNGGHIPVSVVGANM